MGSSQSLEELALCKRLVQARMDIHRTEMLVYGDQVAAPFRRIGKSVHAVATNPFLQIGLVGSVGFLIVSKRFTFLRKAAGWLVPFILPRLRNFVMNRVASSFALKKL